MEIKANANGIIEINGVIKTIEDVENIKKAIENNARGKDVVLKINDSFAMPSALIGYLIKLKSLQKKNVFLKIADNGLYELMRDLNLEDEFNLQKI
jgi:type II secretory pathway component GspD/PulD (secretin)